MIEVEAFEAKNTLGSLLERVKNGEEIRITRHGRPVARLVPDIPVIDQAQVRAAMKRIRARAIEGELGFSLDEFKRDRDAGRP